MPEGQTPTFGNSPCIGSAWGQAYFRKLYNFYETSGFTLLEHDGSYPAGEEKGPWMAFNPLPETVTSEMEAPLYYTELKKKATVAPEDGSGKNYKLDRDDGIRLEVEAPGQGFTWYVIR